MFKPMLRLLGCVAAIFVFLRYAFIGVINLFDGSPINPTHMWAYRIAAILALYMIFRVVSYAIIVWGRPVPMEKKYTFAELVDYHKKQLDVHRQFLNARILTLDPRDMEKLNEYAQQIANIDHKKDLYTQLGVLIEEISKADPHFESDKPKQ